MLKKFIIKIKYLLLIIMIITQTEAFSYYEGMMDFENRVPAESGINYTNSIYSYDICRPMSVNDYKKLGEVFLPKFISEDSEVIPPINKGEDTGAATIANLQIAALVGMGIIGFIVVPLISLEVCKNSYIMQPHEWMNFQFQTLDCQLSENGRWYNAHPKAFTATDIPYFFTCDALWNPETNTQIQDSIANKDRVGHMWGYAGSSSALCNNPKIKSEHLEFMKTRLDHIYYVHTGNLVERGVDVTRPRCGGGIGSQGNAELAPGFTHHTSNFAVIPFYNFDQNEGKISLCVASYDTLPVQIVGCSNVAPPSEDPHIEPELINYAEGTRCSFFLTGRKDLNALGDSLSDQDQDGNSGVSVKRFLQSEMHFTSTVVGCIKDLILRSFINPQEELGTRRDPFFATVQGRLKDLVTVVLVLYLTLVGIRVMTSAQQLSKGEYMIFILKFALVAYFSTPGAWYSIDSNNKVTGLLPAIFETPEQLANVFLRAQNQNDPIGMCKYKLEGVELLSQRSLDATNYGGVPTKDGKILMTIWDYIDCKIVNYLNFNSCDYSIVSIVVGWIIGAAFLSPGGGFLLSLASFLYALLFMLIIFKFAHIFIMTLFVLVVLIVISPLILCFALFEPTKQIFQTWFKLILGYMLYPALLMAFLSLMLVTFDTVFYGDLAKQGLEYGVTDICNQEGAPAACIMIKIIGQNPCAIGAQFDVSEMFDIWERGPIKITYMKGTYVTIFLSALSKLLLFVVLFYFFMGSVTSFLEILVGVQGLSGLAMGGVNILAPFKKAGAKAASGLAGLVGGSNKEPKPLQSRAPDSQPRASKKSREGE